MPFLLLSILCSTLILVIFKFLEKLKINNFHAIILNYITATTTGMLINPDFSLFGQSVEQGWITLSFFLGLLLVTMFFIIGLSTQKAGITITSVASKISVVIPILYSALFFSEKLTAVKIIAVSLALVAISLSVYKSEKVKRLQVLLPVILFFGIGTIDSLIKYAQAGIISNDVVPFFSAMCFGMAGFIGLVASVFMPGKLSGMFRGKVVFWGIFLGLSNYGSMYFMFKALNANVFESSITFGVNNVSILTLSILAGLLFFKEKLTVLNWVGIILSVISIGILAYI